MIWNLKLIYCNILTDNYILEYIANYRNSETSDIKLLITLFQQDDFAEKLFDCQNMDNIHIFKKFLDVSMPALAKGNFKQQMAFEPLTTVVTASEETFALLVLENNLERWIFLANKEITLASGSTREFGVTPDVKYQKKVKKRKDNRETAGRWTEQGMKRFNEVSKLVLRVRMGSGRDPFLKRLMEAYELDDDVSDWYAKRKRKRIEEEEIRKNGHTSKVRAVNMLDLGTI